MKVEYNVSKTLMIHSYQSKILQGDTSSELHLDDIMNIGRLSSEFIEKLNQQKTIITFDDGLYQQIELIKLFDPNENQVIFFPSFGLVRPEDVLPKPIENSIAHSNKLLYLSTFMSSAEIWDLMRLKYKLGMHGWYHLNLNLNQNDIGSLTTLEKLRLLKDDSTKCVQEYYKYIEPFIDDYIIDNELVLYFCTPYNCMNDMQKIYIDLLADSLQKTFTTNIPIKLQVFSNERIPIENFIKEIHNAVI